MAADILEAILRANLAAALAVVLALCVRRPLRASFGASAAYAVWAMAPVAALASLTPAWVASPVAGAFPMETLRAAVLTEAIQSSSLELAPFALAVWLIGVLAGLATMAIRQIRLSRALGRLRIEGGDSKVAYTERSDIGPAVIGVLSPKIVLPSNFHARYAADEQALILAHEAAHKRAGDTRINALIALMRCLCWFNPFIHLGAVYAHLDQELARDAVVTARFPSSRRCYAETMLKAQLAAGAVALGCSWTPQTAQLMKKRIAMLAKPTPNRFRRAAGATVAASATVLAGFVALIGQPTPPALAQSEPPNGAVVADGSARMPLVRIAPDYPADALDREADCDVSFDIADSGVLTDVSATCTDPVFEAAAETAVGRWRYVTRADDDGDAPRTDVMVKIEFRPVPE